MRRKLVLLTALIIVLVGTLGVAFKVQRVTASGTITIKADGTIDQPTPPLIVGDGTTYNFTKDIDDYNIVVQRSNIIIDGKLHSLTGSGIGPGFSLTGMTGVTIRYTLIQNFTYGVFLDYSHHNYITENTIQNNSVGVNIYGMGSTVNFINGNSIVDNGAGVEIGFDSRENVFYHNAFIGNGIHARVPGGEYNIWHWVIWGEGCVGNYWDNYTGVDFFSGLSPQNETGSDGIGDTPYVISENNTDYYPLMGRFIQFCGETKWGQRVCIWIICSSPDVWGIYFGSIGFNVTGPDGTDGFCRVTIPHDLMEPPYTVTVNNNPVTHTTLFENETLSIIYFTYTHSTKEVVIVPEFPSFLIPPLFMIATLVAVIIYKRKHPTQHYTPPLNQRTS